jgi:hypothetical protein
MSKSHRHRQPLPRYRPYYRPNALHLVFAPETPIASRHSAHVKFGREFDTSFLPPVVVLATQPVTAEVYFASDAANENQGIFKKPQGEAGRPGRGGYTLLQALMWPDAVYKEVQVSSLSHSWYN